MKSLAIISAIGIATLVNTASARPPDVWERNGKKNGITVFTMPVVGSSIPKVKGITTIDAHPDSVWKAISNGEVKAKGIKERKIIGRCESGCEYVYVRIGNALITDRHYVIKVETTANEVDGGTKFVRTWAKVDGKTPRDIKAENIKKISGSWTVEPIPGTDKTKLTYINHLDLGGFVPAIFFAPKFVEKSYDILDKVKNSI